MIGEPDREHREDATPCNLVETTDANHLPGCGVEIDRVGAERVVRLETMAAGGDLATVGFAVAEDLDRLIVKVETHPAILNVGGRVAHDLECGGGFDASDSYDSDESRVIQTRR